MNAPTATLTPASQQALAEAALVLEHAQGFVYVPILVPSERAAALAMDQLQTALPAQTFRLPWPLPQAHTDDPQEAERRLQADLQTVVAALDDATHRLPAAALILLDAASSLRHPVARRLPVWLNQRREDWRRRGQGLLLLWPQTEREALMQGAPDLWSMRAITPWVEERLDASAGDTLPPHLPPWATPPTAIIPLSPTQQRQWDALLTASSWSEADVSAADVLGLLEALHQSGEVARGLALAERVMHAPEFGGQSLVWRAHLMRWLTALRSEAGDYAGALLPAQKAVDIYRGLALTNPVAFDPDLAGGLNNLAISLSETGDLVGALAPALEALSIRRRLAQADPGAYEFDLAMSLSNVASALRNTGNRVGALALAREAVVIRRRLAQSNPAKFDPDLAISLNILTACLSETGDRAGALASAQEAVAIYRRLDRVNPVAHESNLARSLNNLTACLSETSDRAGALATAQEALAMYRRLAQGNPAVHQQSLAISLNNLANCLSKGGDHADALTLAQEAVTIYGRLAKANPAAYEPDLAMSLNTLANRLSETGDRMGALAPAQEAVTIRRRLAKANPAAYEPNLAISLWTAMRCHAAAAQRQAALLHGREALQRFTLLAQREPTRFEPYRQTVETEVQALEQA